MAYGKISLARGINHCPIFSYFFCPTSVYTVKRMCAHTHICVETVYELQLLPNNTAAEIFLHISGAVRSVDWIFISGALAWRWTGRIRDIGQNVLQSSFHRGSRRSHHLLPFSSLSHTSRRPVFRNIM